MHGPSICMKFNFLGGTATSLCLPGSESEQAPHRACIGGRLSCLVLQRALNLLNQNHQLHQHRDVGRQLQEQMLLCMQLGHEL